MQHPRSQPFSKTVKYVRLWGYLKKDTAVSIILKWNQICILWKQASVCIIDSTFKFWWLTFFWSPPSLKGKKNQLDFKNIIKNYFLHTLNHFNYLFMSSLLLYLNINLYLWLTNQWLLLHFKYNSNSHRWWAPRKLSFFSIIFYFWLFSMCYYFCNFFFNTSICHSSPLLL